MNARTFPLLLGPIMALVLAACITTNDPADPQDASPDGKADTPSETSHDSDASDASAPPRDAGPCPTVEPHGACDGQPIVARDPVTAVCCLYPEACVAPEGWVQFEDVPTCQWTCPPSQPPTMCNMMMAFACSPDVALCCGYATPCGAPDGWETYWARETCEATFDTDHDR